ncbi:unannotated protein [freshwater metagenome]|uniref:Unannotated protein n=1 Tax=freshwater metagenome TaxID=449393 RepID=A0A6J7QT81_9ZZZZ
MYSSKISSSVVDGLLGPGMPVDARERAVSAATESIGGAYGVADRLEAAGATAAADQLRLAAADAFMPALHTASFIALGLLVLALIVFLVWLPANAEAASWSAGGSVAPPSVVPGGRVEADGEADALHQVHLVVEDPEHLAHVDEAPLELDVEPRERA